MSPFCRTKQISGERGFLSDKTILLSFPQSEESIYVKICKKKERPGDRVFPGENE